MNTHAVNEFIAQSPFIEWYNSQNFEFSIPEWKIKLTFSNISSFHEFLDQQHQGWYELEKEMPAELLKSRDKVVSYRILVEKLFNSDLQSLQQLGRIWEQIKNQITQENKNEKPTLFNLPETKFLAQLYKINHETFIGGLYFYIGNFANAQRSKELLKGYFLAYEFDTKIYADLIERKHVNDNIIEQWNEKTSNYFNVSESHLNNYINSTKANFDKVNRQILTDKQNNSNEYNEWFAKVTQEQIEFQKGYSKEISELAQAYEEKLRLEKPASYWAERAVQLKKEAKQAISWLIGIIAVACISLYFLLWKTPQGMLEDIFNGNKSSAIRWSIVFIIFLSFLFYGVRTLMKVTFSSLHLARDAEERERLTYVYLAMIKNSSVEKDDRKLIMQSLYSRADTGLLKDDGGPTMPGSIIEKLNK